MPAVVGIYSLEFYSTDVAGNQEATRTSSVTVKDTTPPVTSVSGLPTLPTRTDVTVTLSRSEPGTTYYRLNAGSEQTYSAPFIVSSEGENAIEFWTVDAGGLEETPHQVRTFTIDKSSVFTQVNGIPDGWTNENVQFTLTRSLPGVTYYRLGSAGATQTYSSPVTVSSEGNTPLEYWSIHSMDKEESHRTAAIRIDKTAPVSSIAAVTTLHPGTVINISVADGSGSGRASTHWRLSSSSEFTTGTSLPAPLTVGPYTLQYYSVDRAGNVEVERTFVFTVKGLAMPKLSRSPAVSVLTIWRSGKPLSVKRTFSVRMFKPSGVALKGKAVHLQTSKNGSAWTRVATYHTDSKGRAKRTLTFKSAGTRYYRWYSPGNTTYRAVAAAKTKVVVR